MITLYTFGTNFGLPDPSPFVLKTEVQLKMAGLDYRSQLGGLPTAPKGKLPYIDDDGVVVADSVFIRAYLEKTYGIDFDAGVSPGRRALAWTVERMVEDHLYFVMLHARWTDDENFAKGPAHFFDAVPEPMREEVRRQARERVAQNLHGQGLGRHSPEEIGDVAARSIAALSELLGGLPYLGGEKPCGADASLFGLLAGVMTPLFDTSIRRAALSHDNLVAYERRMMAQYYPEFA
ncbi:glutathione S-transferase C-terminal domain-containing protein [Phenylobacterium montanum]|uniref:Glutathione S-transferase C-terminal domain-containing protein n=1 Tax=Phenylobacterium montanum TaxID=2823693 RepID=A0A975ISZ7_9CAUL|nr:glutathione S-transferase C-terminal domain-containing protein [Caulobacter sp. S6]QUD86205.1 glutathione S-transferase C-terminal domain-containing protein [Caulobacter sp. S6]